MYNADEYNPDEDLGNMDHFEPDLRPGSDHESDELMMIRLHHLCTIVMRSRTKFLKVLFCECAKEPYVSANN